ncbi:hypothetical protein HNO88_002508 [Novosphingobium chloroacetimidivorans]|uniref:Uncharacterized protein n=2 Tax=Novosphingobium chloroacetimidivorans TaxID=1428314 RepID=A0A7W7KBG2_9SPHN|nr:hypothetical protein [Novosphingobium chloroacetimidivorans]
MEERGSSRETKMSITFYVTDLDTRIQSVPATISPRELGSFRAFMREQGTATEDDPDGEPERLTYAFDASICRFAIASIARIFGNRHEAIAVIEEAQFLGRLLSFRRKEVTHELSIEVSQRLDGPGELDLANGNAYAVLEALDLEPESIGEITFDELRMRLSLPTVRQAFRDRRIHHRLPFFDVAAALDPHEQSARLVWA